MSPTVSGPFSSGPWLLGRAGQGGGAAARPSLVARSRNFGTLILGTNAQHVNHAHHAPRGKPAEVAPLPPFSHATSRRMRRDHRCRRLRTARLASSFPRLWLHRRAPSPAFRNLPGSEARRPPGLAGASTRPIRFALHVFIKAKCSHFPPVSYVSPRKRAQRTFELLNLGLKDPLPWNYHGACPDKIETNYCDARVQVTEDIREWDCEFVSRLPFQSLKPSRCRYPWTISPLVPWRG